MKRNKIIIIIFLLFTAVIFYLKSSEGIFNCDDIQYGYCIGEKGETTAETLTRPIQSITDILVYQYNHYFTCNGRSFVHLAVQFFDGLVTPIFFYIANTAMFLLAIWLFVELAFKKSLLESPWTWLIASVVFLYGIEYSNLWYNPAFSINYLWTSVISMAFTYLWLSGRIYNLFWLLPFSFFAGWQHEMFGIAIAGALVVYCILYRTLIDREKWLMAICYIIGAMFVGLASGSHQRFIGMGGALGYWAIILVAIVLIIILIAIIWVLTLKGLKGRFGRVGIASLLVLAIILIAATHPAQMLRVLPLLGSKVLSRIEFVNELFMLKYLIITLIITYIICGRRIVNFIKDNGFMCLCLLCSCAFVVGLRIRGRAEVGLNLFSAILFVRLLAEVWNLKVPKKILLPAFIIVAIALFIHQGFIISAMSQYKLGYERVMSEYKASKDGIVIKTIDIYPKDFDSFINDIIVPVDKPTAEASWSRDMFALKYGKNRIALLPFNIEDFKGAKLDSVYYSKTNEIYPNSGLYTTKGSEYIWVDVKNQMAQKYIGGLKLVHENPFVQHKNFDLYLIEGTDKYLVKLHTTKGEAALITK